ncbi:MAG: alpha-L-fucosidase, partial [Chloroflexi bacterium]
MTTPNSAWFTESRFGMFIHWGIYSLAARHEWIQNYERIAAEDYQKYFDYFDPDLYDPVQWAQRARDAGMKYVVLTTKHHDGFCLWDSALTDFKAINTPYGKDLLAPFVQAFRDAGLKIGFYHSLIDWHHPEFPLDGHHPMRDDLAFREQEKGRDIRKYQDYLHGQVRELLTGYGKIDIMWFDFSYPVRSWDWAAGKGKDDWRSEELMAMVRELQPGILFNNRLDVPGDFVTPEQYQPLSPMTVNGEPVLWEACQTLNGSWGYDRDNLNWKSSEMLIQMLVDSVSKNGNLLLNVGPNGRGEFEPRAIERLNDIGAWMRVNGRSIYGCSASKYTVPTGCRYTQRGNRLYVHLLSWPFGHVHLPDMAGKVAYAQFLHDASEIKMAEYEQETVDYVAPDGVPPGTLSLVLPVQTPAVTTPV